MAIKTVINFQATDGAKTVVTIGEGKARELIGKFKQAYIVADKKVASLYPLLFHSERVFLTEGGEDAKSIKKLGSLLEWLSNSRCTRGDMIIAVGGGSVGDLAGFAAAVYMRGVRWNVVPTTLLSMTDSSLGGKTAVNIGGVKNLAGAFHQPERVVIDPSFLLTLPETEYISGMGEVIKTAAIADKKLFNILSVETNKVLSRDITLMKEVIAACCRIKGKIVSADPCESDKRMALNAGHTIAHAIESDSCCRIPHGHAVAIGLYIETFIGEKLVHCKKGTADKIAQILALYNCPSSYIPESAENFIKVMESDKKRYIKDILYIPFIKKIGKTVVNKTDAAVFYDEARIFFSRTPNFPDNKSVIC
ncbi:MAG: 3-dehydroquinate synthase [Deferribacteraceae bacterium]|jgi:3-dehydroquinate synthase|nr:3-dehydroquinate synthase [Deferribacteraceae bacterium]